MPEALFSFEFWAAVAVSFVIVMFCVSVRTWLRRRIDSRNSSSNLNNKGKNAKNT